MRIAVIADIHGNADALDAVLADIADNGRADLTVCLGDHFSGPLDAAGTAERLVGSDIVCIAGNHDRYLLTTTLETMGRSDEVAFRQLTPAVLEWLRALPPTLMLPEDVFLCHGTPDHNETYWLETVTPDGRMALSDRAEVEARARGVTARLMLCAHSHVPRAVRLGDGRMVLNPGSVGCPGYLDDAPAHAMQAGLVDASYAVVERTAGGWRPTFHLVPYDAGRMVALAEAEARDDWARALSSGWMR